MKKLITLFFTVSLLASCSSDDDAKTGCENEVWRLRKTCDNSDCEYTVTYGSSEDNLTTIETNEATYNYYDSHKNENGEIEVCWEGEKFD